MQNENNAIMILITLDPLLLTFFIPPATIDTIQKQCEDNYVRTGKLLDRCVILRHYDALLGIVGKHAKIGRKNLAI